MWNRVILFSAKAEVTLELWASGKGNMMINQKSKLTRIGFDSEFSEILCYWK